MEQPFTLLAAFNVALALLGAVGGWAMKALNDRVRDLREDSKDLRRELGELHTRALDKIDTKADKSTLERIFTTLQRIEDKVDRKLDAPVRFKPTSDFAPLEGVNERRG